MVIRSLVNALRFWRWSRGYLSRQKRSRPRQYASMGRFRESHLWPSDERWDRFEIKPPREKGWKQCICFDNKGDNETCPVYPREG